MQVNFTSIPATYDNLVIIISARLVGSSGWLAMFYNGNNSSGYTNTAINGSGSTVTSSRNTGTGGQDSLYSRSATLSGYTSNTFSNSEIFIPQYRASQLKTSSTFAVAENNSATVNYVYADAGLSQQTSAITSIGFMDSDNNGILAGSSFYLYGIKNS